MNTADLAHRYGRELFAVPGRPSDLKSGGCHQLLLQQKAQVLTNPMEVVTALGWNQQIKPKVIQKPLFIELTAEEQQLFTQFSKEGKIHLDHLALSVGWKVSATASLLMQMEMKGMVRALPGKYFEWI
jgi:DNA processing protein